MKPGTPEVKRSVTRRRLRNKYVYATGALFPVASGDYEYHRESPHGGLLERKYSHRGYMDSDAPKKKEKRPPENRARQEQIGPRTPRMVGTITLARCSNCGVVLRAGFDPKGRCPQCGFELHCCKQCVYFDTSARFECTQHIP